MRDDTLKELLGFDNHYKFVATWSWLVGLAWDAYFILHGAPYTFILAWTSLVYVAPYGLKGLTAWLNRKGAAEEVTAIATESKAILERRAKVGGDYEPTD
jgi:hypothetical protein